MDEEESGSKSTSVQDGLGCMFVCFGKLVVEMDGRSYYLRLSWRMGLLLS